MSFKGQCIDMSIPIVGGNWNNSSNAGLSALNLNNVAANSNNNAGLRDCGVLSDTSIDDDTDFIGIHCPALSEINRGNLLSKRIEKQKTSKRIGMLYKKISSIDALYAAYLDARMGKRNKKATFVFEKNLGAELEKLSYELKTKTYAPRPYKKFYVFEPKKREINAPHFRDLVVQHAIYREIYDLFNNTFIDQSFACRKGKGTHSASAYTQQELKKYDSELYCLKLDVRKFFYRIDRDILKRLFEKKIKDKTFIDLMCEFAKMDTPIGIPIGNLLSQLYALIYLNKVDHFIKRDLHVKSYVRYVDDMVLIGLLFEQAKHYKVVIESFLKDELHLELSKWTISKIKKGVNFVGYRTWKTKKFVRKHSMIKFKKACKKENINAIASLLGHAKGTNTMPYFTRIIDQFKLKNQIPTRSQKCLSILNIPPLKTV